MDDGIVIRAAKLEDIPAVLGLYTQPAIDAGVAISNEEAIALFNRFKNYPNYNLYVACTDAKVVGTFALLIMDNLGHLGSPSAIVEAVAVNPNYQRRGIGKQMMHFAMKKASKAHCYKLTLSAAKHRNTAHQFYESLGFEKHGYSFNVMLDS